MFNSSFKSLYSIYLCRIILNGMLKLNNHVAYRNLILMVDLSHKGLFPPTTLTFTRLLNTVVLNSLKARFSEKL